MKEDEGPILDAMQIYSVEAVGTRERVVHIVWSTDGLQAALYLDEIVQALVDFKQRRSYSHLDFPNLSDRSSASWRTSSHAWDEKAWRAFSAALPK